MANSENIQQGKQVDYRCQCGELEEENFSTTVYCLVLLGVLPEFLLDAVDWDQIASFLRTNRAAN